MNFKYFHSPMHLNPTSSHTTSLSFPRFRVFRPAAAVICFSTRTLNAKNSEPSALSKKNTCLLLVTHAHRDSADPSHFPPPPASICQLFFEYLTEQLFCYSFFGIPFLPFSTFFTTFLIDNFHL
ncbi:unnamed protein product [Ceratitis capitata]|uniref:(Mediterranean fruit fly) hypothetical protein n=1 Tax=Ceratitis capitata TaxID=7213 RepID=A0A811V937_CERCA|nr:unnamed protein product [Ceratitis capitata]